MKPIRNDADHRAALTEIENLWDAEPGTPEHDRLEILGTLVSAFEDQAYPLEDSDPIEAIKYWMDQKGKTRNDLAILFGSHPRASEVLNKKRPLTMRMVWQLRSQWGLPADTLVRPYKVMGEASTARSHRAISKKRAKQGRVGTASR
jgi:HTH-type transcriptional regulator/antitoxin HigA